MSPEQVNEMETDQDSQPTYEPGVARLKFLVGESPVYTREISALVCVDHFMDMPASASRTPPVELLARHRTSVAQIISCPVAEEPPVLSVVGGLLRYRPRYYKHYYVDTQGAFSDYLAKMSGKTRSTLKRKAKKYAKQHRGQTFFEEYSDPDRFDEFFELAGQVSAKSYQERLLGTGLPRDAAYIAKQKQLAAQGLARGYLLSSEGRPTSYVYGPVFHGRVFLYDYVGYDPDFNKWSPGTVLQYLILERLFEDERVEVYDLCVGEGEHKRLLATGHRDCADLLFLKPYPHNVLTVLAHSGLARSQRAVVQVLDRYDLKARIKKYVRARGGK